MSSLRFAVLMALGPSLVIVIPEECDANFGEVLVPEFEYHDVLTLGPMPPPDTFSFIRSTGKPPPPCECFATERLKEDTPAVSDCWYRVGSFGFDLGESNTVMIAHVREPAASDRTSSRQ